jgi:tRNA A37 threonylcarbamoyladenosine modification protein TsaB
MYKVYVDTSERKNRMVRLVEVENGEERLLGEKTGDIDVVSSLKELLVENSLKPVDVSEYVPNLGPGSFTGLKVGVTVTNILNWATGRKKVNELDQPEYGGEPNITVKKGL